MSGSAELFEFQTRSIDLRLVSDNDTTEGIFLHVSYANDSSRLPDIGSRALV